MADLNAKAEVDNSNYEHMMRKHGIGTMNKNGELFAVLCSN